MTGWRELVAGLLPEATFGEPATGAEVRAIVDGLGQPVPKDLTALLCEVGSVRDSYGTEVVWSAARILRDNRSFRADADYRSLYMPFEPLMFFGDAPDASQFGFVRQPVRPDVFVWDHETDGRWWVARDLEDYLRRAFATTDPDWWCR
ncbi:SMI1/KNR4 family protein [Virgisporangium aliadipatigenens]|uniref:SMI1/KNR4 family protein n=1 Tax=Virgisporangium aliadipatigenens TaxID=741659 RepID=A0A8J4DPD8_9ACTN|nr:SMI1/KNR4 family protein [Virgisporangium aliadipatigenens]GIJ44801.1 SMI1/KNR4 family protein [Virgisporangium aliadipatigenens]